MKKTHTASCSIMHFVFFSRNLYNTIISIYWAIKECPKLEKKVCKHNFLDRKKHLYMYFSTISPKADAICLAVGLCDWQHDRWCVFCFVLAERSQDSEVVMLSDSNSTQDAFTDPTSSQDSNHKPASGKASSSSSESTTPVKDGQSTFEDTGRTRIFSGCVYLYQHIVSAEGSRFIWQFTQKYLNVLKNYSQMWCVVHLFTSKYVSSSL